MNREADRTQCAAIYIRVSTEEQATGGVSLSDQEARTRAYCALHQLKVLDMFRDEGVSAGKPLAERPAGTQLIAAVARGDAQHVVAMKLDRLFRDAVDCLQMSREWDSRGVAMHLIDLGGQTVNTTSAMGRFMLTVVAGAAEMERNLIRERTRSALRYKQERGDRLGTTPLGYVTPAPGQPMEREDRELATVKLILALRRRDPKRWSFREIAARLKREGHRTKRGGAWAAATVKRVWDRRARYQ